MYTCITNIQALIPQIWIWPPLSCGEYRNECTSIRSALKPLGKKLELRPHHIPSPPLFLSSASWEAVPLCRGPRRKISLQSSTYTGIGYFFFENKSRNPKELMCEFSPPRRITSPRGQFNVLSRTSITYVVRISIIIHIIIDRHWSHISGTWPPLSSQ